jgi:hypothetical protein
MNDTKIQRITNVGHGLYFGGGLVSFLLALPLLRHQAREEGSDLKSMLSVRKSAHTMGRHKVLTAIWAVASLAQLAGMVIRGPRLTITEFPATEDLFPAEPKEIHDTIDDLAGAHWRPSEDGSGLIRDEGKSAE